MSQSKVFLKNAWLAAVLAYLIPGAGHFYQGRMFKGVLYSVCILGTFYYGQALGDWKVVHYHREPYANRYGYFSQMMVGLSALPALVQHRRFHHPDNQPTWSLAKPISEPFVGRVRYRTAGEETVEGHLEGRIELIPAEGQLGPEIVGTFRGTFEGEQDLELSLGGPLLLEQQVYADSRRSLECEVLAERGGRIQTIGHISGEIPRSFRNWYQVPLEKEQREQLNGRLGKLLELAYVLTWIAGLLNILAIWDAWEGPAYGYGDEEESADTANAPKNDQSAEAAPSSPTPPEKSVPQPANREKA